MTADSRSAPIRVGVIGGGLVSQVVHLPILKSLGEQFDVVALAEPNRELAIELAQRFDVPQVRERWTDLVESDGVDAIIIAAPNALHAPIVLTALEAGIHCFVEKPLCVDPADGARINAAAERFGKVVQVGYMKRFDDAAMEMIAALRSDAAVLLHADALTVDPGLSRYFSVGQLISGIGRPDRSAVEELERAELEQCEPVLGSDSTPALRRMYIDIFLGALVHDVNLLSWIADAASLGALKPSSASIFRDVVGAQIHGQFGDSGVPWTATWALTPELDDFQERIRVVATSRVHELTFDAPYGSTKRRGTRYDTARGGHRVHVERPDRSFAGELHAFAEAIHGNADAQNTVTEAQADIELLAELIQLAIQRESANA